MVACTATATKSTAEEIKTSLNMQDAAEIRMPIAKSNLHIFVVSKRGTPKDMHMVVQLVKLSSAKMVLLFCLQREECERVAHLFMQNNVPAESYHSGTDDRQAVEDRARSGAVMTYLYNFVHNGRLRCSDDGVFCGEECFVQV
jgi:superfamily II DNA helicase RecQ